MEDGAAKGLAAPCIWMMARCRFFGSALHVCAPLEWGLAGIGAPHSSGALANETVASPKRRGRSSQQSLKGLLATFSLYDLWHLGIPRCQADSLVNDPRILDSRRIPWQMAFGLIGPFHLLMQRRLSKYPFSLKMWRILEGEAYWRTCFPLLYEFDGSS